MNGEDRPLTHGRDLTEFLDRYGIVRGDRAEALELLKGIRGGVQIDDVRHCIRPITVPWAAYTVYEGVTGGAYSACLLSVGGGGGAYIVTGNAVTNNTYVSNVGIPAFTPTGAVTPAAVVSGDGALPVSTVQTGTIATRPAFGIYHAANIPWWWCPSYFAPGSTVLIYQNLIGTALSCSLVLQEIP